MRLGRSALVASFDELTGPLPHSTRSANLLRLISVDRPHRCFAGLSFLLDVHQNGGRDAEFAEPATDVIDCESTNGLTSSLTYR